MTTPRKYHPPATRSAEEVAIERAKSAFLCARTAYGRKKALRRLEELGVGPARKGG